MKPRRRWHSCALWLVLGAMLAGSCRPDRDGSGENSSTPGSGSGDESTQPGSVYTAQELDQEPRVINQTDIFGLMAQIHPTLHLDPGTRAEVIARFAVRPDGMVDTASIVVVGSTAPKLSEATIRVVQALRYHPGRKDGEPVASLIEVPFTWSSR